MIDSPQPNLAHNLFGWYRTPPTTRSVWSADQFEMWLTGVAWADPIECQDWWEPTSTHYCSRLWGCDRTLPGCSWSPSIGMSCVCVGASRTKDQHYAFVMSRRTPSCWRTASWWIDTLMGFCVLVPLDPQSNSSGSPPDRWETVIEPTTQQSDWWLSWLSWWIFHWFFVASRSCMWTPIIHSAVARICCDLACPRIPALPSADSHPRSSIASFCCNCWRTSAGQKVFSRNSTCTSHKLWIVDAASLQYYPTVNWIH